MGLKINNEIGCDKGITSSAYVRINTYTIDKIGGYVNINYLTYLNKDESVTQVTYGINNNSINNIKLGTYLSIPIQKEISEDITNTSSFDDTQTTTKQTITKLVPDLSLLDNVNIFSFCYGKLKEKLLIDFNDIIDD